MEGVDAAIVVVLQRARAKGVVTPQFCVLGA